MRTFLVIFWGAVALLTTVATFYVLINYEVQRWKDKKRWREGILYPTGYSARSFMPDICSRPVRANGFLTCLC